MSEFEPEVEETQDESTPVEEIKIASDVYLDPVSDPADDPNIPDDIEGELEYYALLFSEGKSPVTGAGAPSIDLRLLAWRSGYSILRKTETGWTTVKRS